MTRCGICHTDYEPSDCSECGHGHFHDSPRPHYEPCPIQGCSCGMNDAPEPGSIAAERDGVGVCLAIFQDAHDGDDWGSVMLAWFACADALDMRGEDVPDAWEYRRGLNRTTEEERREDSYVLDMLLSGLDHGDLTADDIRTAGDGLMAESARLRAAGRDY